MKLAKILIPPLNQEFSYLVTDSSLKIGSVVKVPFRNTKRFGYIVELQDTTKKEISKLKFKVKEVSNEDSYLGFNKDLLSFLSWISKFYSTPLANVIKTAIPEYCKPQISKIYSKSNNFNQETVLKIRGKKQKEIIKLFENTDSINYQEILDKFSSPSSSLKSLVQKDILKLDLIKNNTENNQNAPSWAKTSVKLNENQEQIVNQINSSIIKNEFKPYLIHGVTGSGKTEVYLELIAKLPKDKNVLIIVPEISLTPQLFDRFMARYPNQIALLHSNLKPRMRWNNWNSILNENKKIVMGARSGIFAPLKNIGLIIVDEEHDSSFKQSDKLRYQARDLAIVRAKFNNCPVILGSATPSIESIYNAVQKKFELLKLNSRYGNAKKVTSKIINLNLYKKKEMASQNISPQLHKAIKEALEKKEQIFILYNRRGFATAFFCSKCADIIKCPNCSISLNYHKYKNQLLCHYCGLTMTPPSICQSEECSKDTSTVGKYIQLGSGTEKVVQELEELFPNARTQRIDSDVVKNFEDYCNIINDVRDKKIDILAGTQMIAKGHDLSNVTLVGIIDCDIGLNFPDFRSSEKVFQLLTQSAGRAGRGEKEGVVYLQTRKPEHYSIKLASTENLTQFAKEELTVRKALNYPPYVKLLRIIVNSENDTRAFSVIDSLKKEIVKFIEHNKITVTILGPARCSIERINNRFRFHLLIKSVNNKNLNMINNFINSIEFNKTGIRLIIDLNPYELS